MMVDDTYHLPGCSLLHGKECDCNKQDIEKTFKEAYAEMEARYKRDLLAHDAAVGRRRKEQQQNFWLGVTLWGLLAVIIAAVAIIAVVLLGRGDAGGSISWSSLGNSFIGLILC
jgi:hypothetical protein